MKTRAAAPGFAVLLLWVLVPGCAEWTKNPPKGPVTGTVVCPVMTGKPGKLPFTPHEGWVDVYAEGDSTGVSARIGKDGKFGIASGGRAALVASFDHLDALPIIVPQWPAAPGAYDIEVWGDYICFPPGYPEVWKKEYARSTHAFYQTFKAQSTDIYACTVFDGPKNRDWGNRAHVSIFQRVTDSETMKTAGGMLVRMLEDLKTDLQTAHVTDQGFPWAGWRHGEITLTPGKQYAVRVCGYKSHSGENIKLPSFVLPDNGDGYPLGQAFLEGADNPTKGDLCLILQGNSNGQIFESNIRSEEWDIRFPQLKPTTLWGQTFVNHGRSMASVVFYASNGSDGPVSCKVSILKEEPGGDPIGPTKTANGHALSFGPYIRYPKDPPPFPGAEKFCLIRGSDTIGQADRGYGRYCKMFQAAFVPDEAGLEPGKTYYVNLEFSEPVLVYTDGDFYQGGFLYHNAKMLQKHNMFHSNRGTLAGQIVTYQNPGGRANTLP